MFSAFQEKFGTVPSVDQSLTTGRIPRCIIRDSTCITKANVGFSLEIDFNYFVVSIIRGTAYLESQNDLRTHPNVPNYIHLVS